MRERILTALVGIPIVLACVFCTSPWPIGILAIAAAAIALREAGKLGNFGLHWLVAVLLASLFLGSAGFRYIANQWEQVVASYCLLLAHVISIFATAKAIRVERPGPYFAAASIYVSLPILGLLQIHSLDHPNGLLFTWEWANPLLMLLLPIWAGDSAAIFAGKAFGRHKLAESISPNKTWEGAVANLAATVATATALAAPLGFHWGIGALTGIVSGVLGQAGDLFESWLKRQAGAKDSGDLLPGHGGILDRIDSLLFASIPVFAILATARHGWPW